MKCPNCGHEMNEKKEAKMSPKAKGVQQKKEMLFAFGKKKVVKKVVKKKK